MALLCEDMAPHGVILISPSAVEYPDLAEDIEHRARNRPSGAPPVSGENLALLSTHRGASAILRNQANVSIVAIAYIWFVRGANGCIIPQHSRPDLSALSPAPPQAFFAYWRSIFPGSKRMLVCDGLILGNNTDVWQPAPDELWHGGFVCGSGGDPNPEWQPVGLRLDGVFFADGGFAGPNQLGTWESAVSALEAYSACAALAEEALRHGATVNQLFRQIQELTGSPERCKTRLRSPRIAWPYSEARDLASIQKYEWQSAGRKVSKLREWKGDEAAIQFLGSCAGTRMPSLHRL